MINNKYTVQFSLQYYAPVPNTQLGQKEFVNNEYISTWSVPFFKDFTKYYCLL